MTFQSIHKLSYFVRHPVCCPGSSKVKTGNHFTNTYLETRSFQKKTDKKEGGDKQTDKPNLKID